MFNLFLVFSLGNNSYGQCGVLDDVKNEPNKFLRIYRIEGIDEDISEV